MKTLALIALLALPLPARAMCGPAPCEIHDCLGDSNTDQTGPPLWCQKIGGFVSYAVFVERALGGSSVTEPAVPAPCNGDPDTTRCAREQLAYAISINHPKRVTLNYGTNDLIYKFFGYVTIPQIVQAYQDRVTEAAAAGVIAYVSLTPPVFCPVGGCAYGLNEPDVEALNTALIAHFGLPNVIDAWTGFTAADFNADGIHRNQTGDTKYAHVAANFLNAHH